MTERETGSDAEKQPKLPFSETQRIYRDGVENLIRPMLDDPKSELSRKLEVGEAAFVDTGNDGGSRRKRRLIPIALPIDYKPQTLQPENAHNMAQIYLNGDYEFDETLQEVGDYFSVSKQAVKSGINTAVFDVFPLVQNEVSFESLNFAKPLTDLSKDRFSAAQGGILLKMRNLVQDGADFKKLREAGFTYQQISNVRQSLAKRQESTTIPRGLKSWNDVLGVLNDPETDRVVKSELILDIPIGTYNLYSKKVKGKEPIFISVSEVAKKAGLDLNKYKRDSEYLVEYLASRCIPIGYVEKVVHSGDQEGNIHRYRFVLFADLGECVRIFEDAEGERFERMRRDTLKSRT